MIKTFKITAAALIISALVLCTAAFAVGQNTEEPEILVEPEISVEESAVSELSDEEITQARLIAMLDMNYCYNSSFEDARAVAACATASLRGFSTDVDGYGICVNSSLLAGFVKSFYGIDVEPEDIATDGAPVGYTASAVLHAGTFYHTLVSAEEQDGAYTVLTCMESYFGGDDLTSCLVKSRFVKNDRSEFGFNLISCEIL